MSERLIELFEKLNREFPPNPGHYHNLTLDGGTLLLTLSRPDRWHWFVVDSGDLENPDATVAALRKMLDPAWQREWQRARAQSLADRLTKALFS